MRHASQTVCSLLPLGSNRNHPSSSRPMHSHLPGASMYVYILGLQPFVPWPLAPVAPPAPPPPQTVTTTVQQLYVSTVVVYRPMSWRVDLSMNSPLPLPQARTPHALQYDEEHTPASPPDPCTHPVHCLCWLLRVWLSRSLAPPPPPSTSKFAHLRRTKASQGIQ